MKKTEIQFKEYISPEAEIVEVEVEQVFAASDEKESDMDDVKEEDWLW